MGSWNAEGGLWVHQHPPVAVGCEQADRQREQAEQAEARARQQREELEQALAAATWRAEQAELKESRALQRMQELEAVLASSLASASAAVSLPGLGSHAAGAILAPASTALVNAAEQPQQENGATGLVHVHSGAGAGSSKPAFTLRTVKVSGTSWMHADLGLLSLHPGTRPWHSSPCTGKGRPLARFA